jgi:biotin--protein ligase
MNCKIFFTFLSFFLLLSFHVSSKEVVYIYAGPGVSQYSLSQTTATLRAFLHSDYQLELIFPEQILKSDWEKQTVLLIIPGGADIPYMQVLNGVGNQKIRSFVENGGSFLGICAGSYYGGNFVDFAKGTKLEVQGKRELSFFPGIVRGPILSPYEYKSESGSKAAKISWQGSSGFERGSTFTVYCNGGGYFVDASAKENTNVLASYDVEGRLAAIVECQVGRGKVILSGVHFEYDPELLDHNDEYLQQILPELEEGNEKRIQLIRHLLERLHLLKEQKCSDSSIPAEVK